MSRQDRLVQARRAKQAADGDRAVWQRRGFKFLDLGPLYVVADSFGWRIQGRDGHSIAYGKERGELGERIAHGYLLHFLRKMRKDLNMTIAELEAANPVRVRFIRHRGHTWRVERRAADSWMVIRTDRLTVCGWGDSLRVAVSRCTTALLTNEWADT